MSAKNNNNASSYSVAAHYMKLVTDYAERHQLDVPQLLAQAGVPEDALADPNGRIAYDFFAKTCELTAQKLKEPALGIKLGESIRGGHLGSHGVALMSCANAGDLLAQSARYSSLTVDAGYNLFEQNGDECVRYWRSHITYDSDMGVIQEDLFQATALTLVRFFLNRDDINPNWVSFKHSAPIDTTPYETLFRCPVRFNQAETAVGFNAAYLDLPLPHANEHLLRIMSDVCGALIKQLESKQEPAWLGRARKAAIECFHSGSPDISDVERHGGFATGELKKRFQERGMSFRTFIDELRHSLAKGYIRDPDLSLVDIAYLLGFSEQSAFQRAFKRWTNMTPGEYRQNVHS